MYSAVAEFEFPTIGLGDARAEYTHVVAPSFPIESGQLEFYIEQSGGELGVIQDTATLLDGISGIHIDQREVDGSLFDAYTLWRRPTDEDAPFGFMTLRIEVGSGTWFTGHLQLAGVGKPNLVQYPTIFRLGVAQATWVGTPSDDSFESRHVRWFVSEEAIVSAAKPYNTRLLQTTGRSKVAKWVAVVSDVVTPLIRLAADSRPQRTRRLILETGYDEQVARATRFVYDNVSYDVDSISGADTRRKLRITGSGVRAE